MSDASRLETPNDTRWTRRGWVYLSVAVIAFAGFLTFDQHQADKKNIRSLMKQIIDENIIPSSVEPEFITMPLLQSAPMSDMLASSGIISSEYAGYFTLKKKDNSALSSNCRATTIDFRVRRLQGSSIAGQIDGSNMMALRECAS